MVAGSFKTRKMERESNSVAERRLKTSRCHRMGRSVRRPFLHPSLRDDYDLWRRLRGLKPAATLGSRSATAPFPTKHRPRRV
jgi:hypothetical protein